MAVGQWGAGAGVQRGCSLYLLPWENLAGTGGTGFPRLPPPCPAALAGQESWGEQPGEGWGGGRAAEGRWRWQIKTPEC